MLKLFKSISTYSSKKFSIYFSNKHEIFRFPEWFYHYDAVRRETFGYCSLNTHDRYLNLSFYRFFGMLNRMALAVFSKVFSFSGNLKKWGWFYHYDAHCMSHEKYKMTLFFSENQTI
ncbi:hypothetical protein B9Z55_024059 [Caenorhabditis nigoni]|nr:hypothetical protein B9Z55_024059 [Caenorhabditis nigoni]